MHAGGRHPAIKLNELHLVWELCSRQVCSHYCNTPFFSNIYIGKQVWSGESRLTFVHPMCNTDQGLWPEALVELVHAGEGDVSSGAP